VAALHTHTQNIDTQHEYRRTHTKIKNTVHTPRALPHTLPHTTTVHTQPQPRSTDDTKQHKTGQDNAGQGRAGLDGANEGHTHLLQQQPPCRLKAGSEGLRFLHVPAVCAKVEGTQGPEHDKEAAK
jgi:hypothetical protein